MTDKERLLGLINGFNIDSIEDILSYFLSVYGDDIDIGRIYSLMKTVNHHLECKIEELETVRFVANERARYIKSYLSGTMWPTEKLAREYLQPQIDNAQAIIDACNGK